MANDANHITGPDDARDRFNKIMDAIGKLRVAGGSEADIEALEKELREITMSRLEPAPAN
jgi:hypothetical protein